MKYWIRNILFVLVAALLMKGIAIASDSYGRLEPCIARIEARMPKNWKIVKEKFGEIPEYHYEDMEYNGPKGIYLYLVGDRDVDIYWTDDHYVRHKTPNKEAIELWIMPPEYYESWKRFFIFKGHIRVPELYSNKNARAYGWESLYRDFNLPDVEFPNTTKYVDDGPFRGKKVQSWTSWEKDIKEALDACVVR